MLATASSLRQGMDAMVPPLTDVPSTSLLVPSSGSTLSGSNYLDAYAADPVAYERQVPALRWNLRLRCPVVCTATSTHYGWLCPWDTTTVPERLLRLGVRGVQRGRERIQSRRGHHREQPAPHEHRSSPAGATLSGSTYLDASASNATSVEFLLFGGRTASAPVVCTATPDLLRMVVRLEYHDGSQRLLRLGV